MAKNYKIINEELALKKINLDSSASSYTFRLATAGTTCKIRATQSKYADNEAAHSHSEVVNAEVGFSYKFTERYDVIEITEFTGTGNFVIEQEFSYG